MHVVTGSPRAASVTTRAAASSPLRHAGPAIGKAEGVATSRAAARRRERKRHALGLRARRHRGVRPRRRSIGRVGLSLITYSLARSFLLQQRDSGARSQACNNARFVQDLLRDPATDVGQLVNRRPDRERRLRPHPLRRPVVPARRRLRPGRPARLPPRRRAERRERPAALRPSTATRTSPSASRRRHTTPPTSRSSRTPTSQPHVERHRDVARRRRRHRHRRRRRPRVVGQPPPPPPALARRRRRERAGRGRPRHPPRPTRPTPTSTASSPRSTTWPTPSRAASSARRASRPTSATSCARPLTALTAAVEVLDAPPRRPARSRSQQALDVVVSQVRGSTRWCSTCSRSPALDAGAAEFHPEPRLLGDVVRAGRGAVRLSRPCRSGSTTGGRERPGARSTSAASSASSPTSSTTPASTAAGRPGSPSTTVAATASTSSSRTPARACRRPRRTASSSASPEGRRPATASAPGSASRSWPSTPACTAAGPGSRTVPAAGRGSSSYCRRGELTVRSACGSPRRGGAARPTLVAAVVLASCGLPSDKPTTPIAKTTCPFGMGDTTTTSTTTTTIPPATTTTVRHDHDRAHRGRSRCTSWLNNKLEPVVRPVPLPAKPRRRRASCQAGRGGSPENAAGCGRPSRPASIINVTVSGGIATVAGTGVRHPTPARLSQHGPGPGVGSSGRWCSR